MIKILVIVYLVSFYLSLPGFFSKAGHNAIKGLIPIYNIYILIEILNIHPILLIIEALGLIFLKDRVFIATLIFVFMPFLLADAYDKKLLTGILGFVLPFIVFPYLAYVSGTYIYDMED